MIRTEGSIARLLGSLGLLVCVPALLALGTACAGASRTSLDAGATRADGAEPPPSVDAAGPAAPDAVGIGGEVATDRSDDSAYAQACLDGVDADSTGGADCADDECSAAPSCCVGSTTDACCASGAPALYTLSFAACASLSDCGAPSDVVGAPVLGGGVVPVVDPGAIADSGVIVREPVDLRSGRLTLTARIVAGAPGVTVDAVSVGLFALDAGGARSLPVAAMQVSASLGEVGIVAGDVVVASHPLGASAGAHELSLRVSPSGDVVLLGDDFEISARVEVPSGLVRVGVLGRSEAATLSPVRVESVSVERAACDVPSALVPGALALEDRTGLYDPSSVGAPSLAALPTGERVLAFDAEQVSDGKRAIFLGVEDATRPGTFVVEVVSGRPQPALSSSLFVEEVRDPALVRDGSRWVLYATGIANGLRAIVRGLGAADGSLTFGVPIALETPSDDFLSGAAPERDAPAVVPGVSTLLVAREHTPEGPALVLLDITGGTTAARADDLCAADEVCETPGVRASQAIVARRVGSFEFDADEVAAPSVAYHRGVYRLYYAGRRGLRWSIGMVISADARYWRYPASGGLVVVPTGNGAAALGALDPDVTIDGDGNLALLYTAWNGVDTSLALATQPIRR